MFITSQDTHETHTINIFNVPNQMFDSQTDGITRFENILFILYFEPCFEDLIFDFFTHIWGDCKKNVTL